MACSRAEMTQNGHKTSREVLTAAKMVPYRRGMVRHCGKPEKCEFGLKSLIRRPKNPVLMVGTTPDQQT
jgi:hypothetical protein